MAFPFFTTASSQTDRKMKGAILLPAELKTKAAKNKALQEFIRNVFGEKTFVKIRLKIDGNGAIQAQNHSFSLNAR